MKLYKFKHLKYLKYALIFSIFLLSGCEELWQKFKIVGVEHSPTQAKIEDIYIRKPDAEKCFAGELKPTQRQKALEIINNMRSYHGLSQVEYKKEDDKLTSASALIGAVNKELSHQPPRSWKCFSEQAKEGSKTSNLYLSIANNFFEFKQIGATGNDLIAFLIDEGEENLGHRRWILDPFLKDISYSRVDLIEMLNGAYQLTTASSLKVIDSRTNSAKNMRLDYVAYPYGNYPSQYFNKNWYLSFSLVLNKEDRTKNYNIIFEKAKISVKDVFGKKLQIRNQGFDNSYYSVPNLLRWKVDGLTNNMVYKVKIENILVEGKSRKYEYSFKLQ